MELWKELRLNYSMKFRHAAALALFGAAHFGASVFLAMAASAQLLRSDSPLWWPAIVVLAPLDLIAPLLPAYTYASVFLGWLLLNSLVWTLGLFFFWQLYENKMRPSLTCRN